MLRYAVILLALQVMVGFCGAKVCNYAMLFVFCFAKAVQVLLRREKLVKKPVGFLSEASCYGLLFVSVEAVTATKWE